MLLLGSYHKIPKISPRAYIFENEGLIFGGAYVRGEIWFQNGLG